jgi:hypothetical protein
VSWPGWFETELGSDNRTRSWVFVAAREAYSTMDNPWQISSHPLTGYNLGLTDYRPQISRLTPRQWIASGGGFSLTIKGEGNARNALASLRPGSVVGIYAGKPGMSPSAFACLQRGQLVGFRPVDPSRELYEMTFAPYWAALRTRPARISGSGFDNAWFRLAGQATTLASNYTAGSGTLTVTATTSIQRMAGDEGVIQITPTTGSPFYLKWTALTGSTYTVSTSGEFGTTDVSALAGDVVTNIVYLKGHPADVLRRLLMSTGTANFTSGAVGSNGAFDVYPEDWGAGLDSAHVDVSGLDTVKASIMVVGSGNYNMELLIDAPVENGVTWFSQWMAPLGFFLREHQGQISGWAVQDPAGTGVRWESFGVTDDAIIPNGWSWNPIMADGEHVNSKVVGTSASGTADESYTTGSVSFTSLPSLATRERDITGVIRGNISVVGQEIADRVGGWDTRRRIEFAAKFRHLSTARNGHGGLVRLTTKVLPLFGPDEAASGSTLSNAAACLTGGPLLDLMRNQVVVGLSLFPET